MLTTAINKQEIILDHLKMLTVEQQDTVLEFIEFLQYQTKKQDEQQIEKKQPIVVLEVTQALEGNNDFGSDDLTTDKKYLKAMAKE